MGNCQAIDTASLIIQHPNGKVDRLYWPVNAGEIMKTNPGHYVALLISTKVCQSETTSTHHRRRDNDTQTNSTNFNSVRLTRIKLLKPTDSLVLGQIYRLVTTQDVLQGLKAKQEAKKKRNLLEFEGKMGNSEKGSEGEINQGMKNERNRVKKCNSTVSTAAKSRGWQPSLQSISEGGS
ncbi:uncharacterized protein LOC101220404 [Cucumis sativus]|uniref:DUF4228 domain-containing protein n=1 Tax=Cucumis sativus TaxID=3659 RepID=A0A0A0LU27_CUCSA|nr:uncharacterized protein LOC101220404 [Cucumis sativus]KGN64292.1 hypothetical protein Csa_013589 [Cucumis sativus]